MPRYIDADNMKSIKNIQSANFNSIESIREWIDTQPTADVRENVRGEWRDIQIGNWHGVECTACKIAHDGRDVPRKNGGIVAWDFCPNCGADMRGDS